MDRAKAEPDDLFCDALELASTAERAAYLDRACGGDADLRRRVERLLEAHAEAYSFLAAGPAVATATATPATGAGGSVIGPYKLVEVIGEGGMGTVWLAQQTEPVKRLAALKVIKVGMDSRQVVARFEAERQALALMDHPSIAKVLDGGVTPDGRPYFVMELVKGIPITQFCDERRLNPRERLELFVPVCQAVQHAHQKGVIHRDLKPSNVLVALYDGQPVPKVIDFGVAKAAGQPLTEKTLVTGLGAVVGTPEYMSPEQAELNQLDVDTRSDVYSLGVLLYELLTGTTPLQTKRVKGAALLEILRLVREEEPPRPSTRLSTTEELPNIAANRGLEPKKLSGLVRGELDWIVMKALEKDRNRRYDTANGLAAELERYLNDEHVLACPPSTAYRVRKFLRRNRVAVLTAATVAAALVAGAAVAAWQAVRATRAEAAEAEQRRLAEQNEQTARASAEAEKKAKEVAQDDRNKAVEALESERETSYVHRIALAHREWLADEVARARQLLQECPADLRGWEWRYLRRLCHTELAAFRGHRSTVRGLAFSPDGSRVASVGAQTWVWDAATGKELVKISASSGARAAFSPDGRRLALAGAKTVTVHDAADGRVLARVGQHDARIQGVAFSPDGRRLATAGSKGVGAGRPGTGEVAVWDADTGKELHRFTDLPFPATTVAFSGDGKYVAAGTGLLYVLSGGDPSARPPDVRVWDAASGNLLHTLTGHTYWVTDLAFSPDSTRLASAGADGTVRVWEVPAGKEAATLRGHHGWVRAVAFSPRGNRLASAGDDRVVRVWDAGTGKETNVLRGHTRPVHALAFSPDGLRLASGGGDREAGEVRVWDATQEQEARTYRDHTAGVANVAFSPDGKFLAWSGWSNGAVREVRTGLAWPGTLKSSKAVAFGPGGALIASLGYADQRGGVTLWNSVTAAEVRHFPFAFNAYGTAALAFSADGLRLAALADGGPGVTVWETATGRVLQQFRPHGVQEHAIVFSPDGRRFATSSRGGGHTRVVNGVRMTEKFENEVKVWDTASYKELMTLPGGGLGLAFSPDGARLASGSQDGAVTIWDVPRGKVLLSLRWQTGAVPAVAFSPDGKRLATAGADHTVKIWDALKGREVLTLRGHGDPVTGVAFSPDGRYLASASGGLGQRGQVKVWDAGELSPAAGKP